MSFEKLIQTYIDEKKELQSLVLQIIEQLDTIDDTKIKNLMIFMSTHQYKENKPELEHFLHLISIISDNHHRGPNFFEKIEKILSNSSQFYKPTLSNEEIFSIFQQSKPILLILLKTEIITIDTTIFQYLMSFTEFKGDETYNYFYPELDSFIKARGINDPQYQFKLNEDIENFETNRKNLRMTQKFVP